MKRRDNYQMQAQQAKKIFLGLDHNKLIEKLKLEADEDYLYPRMLGSTYRICRKTGDFRRLDQGNWLDANTHAEVMTLLDLICDSRKDRFLAHRWQSILSFGHRFHQQLVEEADPNAVYFEANLEAFHRACRAMNGTPLPHCDAGYAIELFDGLCFGLQLWLGDEEFPPQLRYLLDENAPMYLKYETMHYAKGLLVHRIRERMKK